VCRLTPTVGSNPTLSARITVVPVAPGFRLRTQTPAKRLKFESHPLRHNFTLCFQAIFLILTNYRVPGVHPTTGKRAFVGEIFLECGGEAFAFAIE
jgi:hypothetical protein